ncbi:DsbA family protein [Macrococcus animalis]|uniref:DsbA family protein n=1 Tax=Macrococcus animalis TaxID=3395467 RepID=UPI0039BEE2DB
MKNKSSLIFTMVLTLLVVGALAAMVFMKQKDKADNESVDTSAVENTNTESAVNKNNQGKDPVNTDKVDLKGQPMLGKESAKVTVIEFGDFKCPACKYFDITMKPELKKKYVDTGKVKLYFIHTPFHAEESILGGLAGETVLKNEPDKYWDFHDELFKLQTHNGSQDKWLTMSAVKKAMKSAGISDENKIIDAIKANEQKAEVQQDIELYQKHNITSTPTIIVDGKVLADPMNIKEVTSAIDKALK